MPCRHSALLHKMNSGVSLLQFDILQFSLLYRHVPTFDRNVTPVKKKKKRIRIQRSNKHLGRGWSYEIRDGWSCHLYSTFSRSYTCQIEGEEGVSISKLPSPSLDDPLRLSRLYYHYETYFVCTDEACADFWVRRLFFKHRNVASYCCCSIFVLVYDISVEQSHCSL